MVRTRFAPSPTGYLHIGGVRTALFNWLFSRRHGGSFVLRIDDTDARRNVDEALEPILDGFRWLGIDWDEGPGVDGDYGPYYQSQRSEIYSKAVDTLLERGLAYRDYATSDELQKEREEAQAEKCRFIYSRRWMAEDDDQAKSYEAEGRQGVVRLKMPREGTCRFTDLIRGEVEFEWAREQDHVIQRADGSCLYHLASSVDDHEMAITHVIRAEEHLSNTPRQIFITQGLGHALPQYAHLPFVAEPGSKTKLSKRKLDKYLKNADFARITEHGRRIAERIGLHPDADTFNPVIVDFYRQVGYLPQAVLNYLLLLGWSLDDKTEHFTVDEMIEHFSLERINSAPASFDPQKLMAFEDEHMQRLSTAEKKERTLPYLQAAGLWADRFEERLEAILDAAGDRIKVSGDILEFEDFFVDDGELAYDETAFEKRLRKPEEAAALLSGFRAALAAADDFSAGALESLMRGFVEEREIKLGQIIHAVRVAATGKGVGFGLFETLEVLGREQVLARCDRALAMLDAEPSQG
jgi:glutamyl-tRNA synthetase